MEEIGHITTKQMYSENQNMGFEGGCQVKGGCDF